jgi:arabinofuranosyltransferase
MRNARRAVVLLALVAVIALDLAFYPKTLDDSFITFRYADHVARGFGLGAWNTNGERVEGYTSALWMLVLALARPLGLHTPTLAKVLGIGAHLATVTLFIAAARAKCSKREGEAFLAAGLVVAFYLPAAFYAASGMETLLFVFLVTLCLVGPILTDSAFVAGVATVLVVWTRPEGLLVAIALGGLHLLRARSRRPALAMIGGAALGGIALFALRYAVYGTLLPNPYYAKSAGAGALAWRLGATYLREWAEMHAPWLALLVLAAIVIAKDRNRVLAGLLAIVVLQAILAWHVGGDNASAFPYGRHLLHLFPIVALLLAHGVTLLGRFRWIVLAASLLWVDVTIARWPGPLGPLLRYGATHYPPVHALAPNAYITWLARMASPTTVIASAYGGEIPYVIDAVHIDTLGLSDSHIAHHGRFDPAGPIDSKTDMHYVVERRPDFIEGYVSGQAIARGARRAELLRRRPAMTTALLDDPAFARDYLFVTNAPYHALDRALFVRRDFWERHPRREEIAVLPMTATALY